MFVYTGVALPIGPIPLNLTPEPATYGLAGIGLVAKWVLSAPARAADPNAVFQSYVALGPRRTATGFAGVLRLDHLLAQGVGSSRRVRSCGEGRPPAVGPRHA
jgi:hypothetical protein